ncbi:MAG: glutaredoxin 3 [Bdellovibrionales bacterium]|nr:glutaredoxin 3 [Bdellovibrionales bacterium]
MKPVKMYCTSYCPFCSMASRLLNSKGIDYEEINLDGKPEEKAELIQKTGHMTVPQIFIGNEFIGGYQELAALDASGQLDNKLNN